MPFVHCKLDKIETPALLRDYHSTMLSIVTLEYDLLVSIYLGHPANFKENIVAEMEEYIAYSEILSKELKKRGI